MSDDASKRFDDSESPEEGDEIHASVEAEVVSDPDEPSAGDASQRDSHEYPDLTTSAERDAAERAKMKAGLSQDVRQWGMFCHLAGFAGFAFPFGGIVGPLVLWQMKKDEHPFIDEQGKEALNFNITMALAITVTSVVAAIGMIFFIGILLLPVVLGLTAVWVAYSIIAALKANEGVAYRYPWTIRFVS